MLKLIFRRNSPKGITQNHSLKLKNFLLNNKYIVAVLIVIILLLVTISFPRRRLGNRLGNEIVPARGGLEQKVSPTPAPPTPTPTLTPQQIVEIQRKKFEEFNSKYGPCKYVPILMYHHVMEAELAKEILATNLNVPTSVFREQMDYLLGKGYHVIGLNELLAGIGGNSLPSKPIVLTFDDGYRDFYENVYPILKEKNFKATLFVISQFVGGERYVGWWQLREMTGSGLVLVGDHTLNHISLPRLSVEEERNQIVSARKILEDNAGQKVDFFAYPYGNANQNARDILKENGFVGAVTTVAGSTQCVGLPYDLQRIRIGGGILSRYGL